MAYPMQGALGALTDPAGSEALVQAATWLQGALLGTIATSVAIVAVAATGFLMSSGRIDWRRGATTLLGCFILFGAGTIAAGIRSAGDASGEPAVVPTYAATPYAPPVPAATPTPRTGYDPYAGASVPTR